jgi:hypothetical protein
MSNTLNLLDKLIKAVSYTYRDDKTAPGLTISALKKGYYCSVVRYDGAFGNSKVVVCKVKADALEDAVKEIAVKFLASTNVAKDPVQELSDIVSSK